MALCVIWILRERSQRQPGPRNEGGLQRRARPEGYAEGHAQMHPHPRPLSQGEGRMRFLAKKVALIKTMFLSMRAQVFSGWWMMLRVSKSDILHQYTRSMI